MIYDTIDHLANYKGICRNLDTAIQFVLHTDLSTLANGKTVVDGEEVFVNVMDAQLKSVETALFEAHRKYADLQISLSGNESIGWLPMKALPEWDEKEDNPLFREYHEPANAILPMKADRFVLMFPQDGHAPCIGEGISHKLNALCDHCRHTCD